MKRAKLEDMSPEELVDRFLAIGVIESKITQLCMMTTLATIGFSTKWRRLRLS